MTDLSNEPVSGLVATTTCGIAAHSCTARYGCPTCAEALKALAELERRLDEQEGYPGIAHDFLTAQRRAETAEALVGELREALRVADAEASIVHDAIWDETVGGNGRLHDNDDPRSAQSAIWRLHDAVRAALAKTERDGLR